VVERDDDWLKTDWDQYPHYVLPVHSATLPGSPDPSRRPSSRKLGSVELGRPLWEIWIAPYTVIAFATRRATGRGMLATAEYWCITRPLFAAAVCDHRGGASFRLSGSSDGTPEGPDL
jgi:hypothetical protein